MAKLYSSSTWPSALSICPFATSPSPSKFFTYGSFRQDAECLGREHSLKGKYHLSANLLFIGFVFNCFARASLVWLNPNQSNRRSAVQWYFPLWWVTSGCRGGGVHHRWHKMFNIECLLFANVCVVVVDDHSSMRHEYILPALCKSNINSVYSYFSFFFLLQTISSIGLSS